MMGFVWAEAFKGVYMATPAEKANSAGQGHPHSSLLGMMLKDSQQACGEPPNRHTYAWRAS